jgi:hypothetical protein
MWRWSYCHLPLDSQKFSCACLRAMQLSSVYIFSLLSHIVQYTLCTTQGPTSAGRGVVVPAWRNQRRMYQLGVVIRTLPNTGPPVDDSIHIRASHSATSPRARLDRVDTSGCRQSSQPLPLPCLHIWCELGLAHVGTDLLGRPHSPVLGCGRWSHR